MTNAITVILCEGRSKQPARQTLQWSLVTALADWARVEVRVIPHLYDVAPDGPAMQYLRSVRGDMMVVAALYPRAAFWLLHANAVQGRMGRTSFFPEEELEGPTTEMSAPAPQRTIWCIDLRDHQEPQPVLAEIERIVVESTGAALAHVAGADETEVDGQYRIEEATRYRWYPVVDRSRCKNCLECLNFCLFGTFGLDEGQQLLVEQPDACRNGCPACARVCPSRAIMFPQHQSPTIAGGPEGPSDAFSLDLMQLFGHPIADAERRRALAEQDRTLAAKDQTPRETDQAQATTGGKRAERDSLDHLVDDVDEMQL